MLIKSSETNRVYLTGGGGPYLFIGIPMMAMGLYLAFLAISSLLKKTEPLMTGLIFLTVGMVFIFVGLLLFLFREGVTLDRLQGNASQWRKLFRNKTFAVRNLNEFHSLELYIHRSPKRTGYIVQLLAEDSKKVILCDLLKLEAAKKCANDASIFLSLPIIDKTIG